MGSCAYICIHHASIMYHASSCMYVRVESHVAAEGPKTDECCCEGPSFEVRRQLARTLLDLGEAAGAMDVLQALREEDDSDVRERRTGGRGEGGKEGRRE
eukprot:GHVU01074880.1.p3 GENE.GHVU01074880.1~~GHVU01074880.1.p3  ORF type:complete len:100 (+),score=23.67 GHVU01074880.1:145-444(+)